MEDNLEEGNEQLSEVFENKGQALLCLKCFAVHNRDPRRRDLFHALVSKMEIQFWRNGAK